MNVPYFPEFVTCNKEFLSYLFNRLSKELDWVRRDGAPRREYWTNTLNQPYTYGSGRGVRTYEPQRKNSIIDMITAIIKDDHNIAYEGCFLNYYENGREHLGWHSDNADTIDHTRPIAVVTLYDRTPEHPRVIRFRKIENIENKVYGPVTEQVLEQGSLLFMPAGFQQTHQHCIPKSGFECRPRISLTFRGLVQ